MVLGAFGYLVPIGSRTLTALQAAPFAAVALGFFALSAVYLGVAALGGGPAPGERVVFQGDGAWLGLVLGVPLSVGAGALAALGLADALSGNLGGTGVLCVAPCLLVPAALLLDLGTATHQRPDGTLVLRRGALWPRVREFPPAELTNLRVTGRSNRGVAHWTVGLAPPAGPVVVLGSWRSAEAAKAALVAIQKGGEGIGAIR